MQSRRWMAATAALAISTLWGAGAVTAQEPAAGVPAVPTGYAELDQALGADQPMKGKQVTIQNQWIEGEGVNFRASLLPFENATGIDVKVAEVPSGMHETTVKATIEGGSPADIIQLAQPAQLLAYGAEGKLVDVATFMDPEKLKADFPATIGLYTTGDSVWGIPYKVDVKSVVWYPIKAFAAAGYEVPKTWDELIALSDKIIADGKGSPWCVGIEASAATGWIITDWIEDVMLRTAGVDAYNKWANLELPFNSPEVKHAFDVVGQIMFTPGYVLGGSTAILATWQGDAMDPMWTDGKLDDPGCWMQKQAPWYGPDFFPDAKASPDKKSQFVVGEDVGLFYFPPIDPAQGTPALGSGDALMVTNDRPEVRAVAQFLALPEGIKAWIDAGSALSANQNTPAEWYTGYKLKVANDIIANATSFGFDASDVMPASGAAFWAGTIDWISADGTNTDAVLQAIDEGLKQ